MSTKLPNKYADLLTLAYETKINVFDENHNSKSDDDYDNPKMSDKMTPFDTIAYVDTKSCNLRLTHPAK